MLWVGSEEILTAVNNRSLLEYHALGVECGKNNHRNEPGDAKQDENHL
jgi:hypothetical protein